MLYSKSHEPMTESLFANPGSEYRGTPFWAWNSKLNKEDLLWQMEQLKKMGYGGVHIHVRTGLETEYLGEEFFELIQACVEKARQEHMLIWLYDEDRWPSGAAGGLVTKNPAYRMRCAVFTRKKRENGHFLAAFDVTLNSDGTLNSYRRMDEIGTPWCITVDFDSLEQHTYTLRDRDTTQQTRLSESELIQFFEQHLEA